MYQKSLNLGEGPILPLLLKMSWPSMLAMLAMAVYNLMDTLWLARLSPQTIAAFTITFPIQLIFAAIGGGTGVGAGSYAARMLGAGEIDKARKTAGQVIILSIFSGALLIAVTFSVPDLMLKVFGGTPETVVLARRYLLWVVIGAPFLLFLIMANNLFRAAGQPNLSMYAILIFTLLGAVLDPLLIFGWCGVPAFGIEGAAMAAVTGQTASGLVSLYFLLYKSFKFQLSLADLKPDFGIIRSIYQTGLPSVVMNLVFAVVIIVYNQILAPYGHLALATLGICFRINGLVMMILSGIGHGVMPLVGFNLGARLYERLINTVGVALYCSSFFAGTCSILIILFAVPILGFFTKDSELIAIAAPALKMIVSPLILAGPCLVWINLLIGLGKGLTSMVLLFIRDALFLIPLMYLFSSFMGIDGVWMAQPVSATAAFFVIMAWSYKELANIRKRKGKNENAPVSTGDTGASL